jgi:hypothetical protein
VLGLFVGRRCLPPNTTATTTSEPADPAGPSTTAGPGGTSIADVDFRNFTYEYPGVGPDDELSEVTVVGR